MNGETSWTVLIGLKLPSLNEYVNACRTNPYVAAKMKRENEAAIALYIRKLPRFEKPVEIEFHWIEDSRRRDYDNIAFAKKFILDALVKCGKLKDDNRRCVTGFTDSFDLAKRASVELIIKEVDMTQDEQVIQYMKDFGSITSMEAFADLGVTRLASRIAEIIKAGIAVDSAFVERENRYGKKVRFKKYWLAGGENGATQL